MSKTQPQAQPQSPPKEWGFTPAAESLNGRLAMLGFLFAVVIEMLSGEGVLHFLNLV
ncbi:MAG: chlorophyll a/b-binding protein [Nodosilinea sp.]